MQQVEELIGKIIIAIDTVLILGDTNSCLCAIAAKIPIFHMEAGNRCFDQRKIKKDRIIKTGLNLTKSGYFQRIGKKIF